MARCVVVDLLVVSVLCALLVITNEVCEDYGMSVVSNCTSGFPTHFHIDKLAKGTDLKNNDKRQVVIPLINFSCNGTITRWIFGAKWKKNNIKTPEGFIDLQIWRTNSTDQYQKVDNTTVMVDMENNGKVYELEASLAFQEGDFLGYFQPDKANTRLNLYLENSGRITTLHNDLENTPVTPPPTSTFDMSDSKYPLIAVRTDPPGCGCGFMAEERVYALFNIPPLITGMRKGFKTGQIIFPSITFSCSGHVTKWILAAKWRNRTNFPELQIWRPTGDGIYEKCGSTTIMWMERKEGDEVYEFPVVSPLSFMAGDILGLFQPDTGQSRLQVRYDDGVNSEFYAIAGSSDMFTTSNSGVSSTNGIPLVTVEIVQAESTSSLLQSTSSLITTIRASPDSSIPLPSTSTMTRPSPAVHAPSLVQSSSSSGPRTRLTPDSTVVATTSTTTGEREEPLTTAVKRPLETTLLSKPSIVKETTTKMTDKQPLKTSSTENPGDKPAAIDDKNSSGLDAGAIAGLVMAIVIILLLVSVTAAILLIFIRRRGQVKHKMADMNINNPNYAGVGPAMDGAKYTKNTESVEIYANPNENPYSAPDIAQHYETPMQPDGATEKWGIYVPTLNERSIYQEMDDIYSYAGLQPVTVVGKTDGVSGEGDSFFTQSDLYWAPASDSAGLYEQLSRNHFREIQRDSIEIKQHLGSGQFGVVSKGVWKYPRGKKEVAIKLLQAGAPENSCVQFLKEAAIMGQFSHRNVISLYGVVTLGEPVMIVMELMSDGDLRDNLINMRPIPGEMPPLSLSQQLLDFCHQISAGMKYLSDKAFLHRDLAARNILVSGKTCKIADFGMARDLEESSYYISQGGQIPVKWTAPEALHYKKYSTASDVWSFGCLMYEIWSLGHKPFEGYTNVEAIRVVQSGRRLAPPPGSSREIYKLMISCWHPNAAERPPFSQLLQILSLSEHDLLHIPEDTQASVLGAPLETGADVYTDLQNAYTDK